jgi:PBP1b-binding outer membrane lipoprotein LpoB
MITFVALIIGCSTAPKVKRIDIDKTVDLSGRWNDTDSRLVAQAVIDDCLKGSWLSKFKSGHLGKKPDVIVGTVVNRSHEHINVQTFTKDLEKALIDSGRVYFVASSTEREDIRKEREDMAVHASDKSVKSPGQEAGADFMLKGTLNSIVDEIKGKRVVYYHVNLELIDMISNRKVWIGEKKIKKVVTRPGHRL